MFKKIVSLLLSIIMIMSVFTVGVMAEETVNLALDSFNATPSKLMIDLSGVSGDIDETTLNGKIELLKRNADGSETAVGFIATASKAKYDTTVTTTVVSDGNTIVITPNDGFEAGVYYRAVLKAGIADEAGNTVAADISTGYFVVNIIYSDDFNVKFDSDDVESRALVSPYIANGSYVLSNNWYNNTGRVGISLPGTALSKATELNNNDDTKLAFTATSGWVLYKELINNYDVEYDYTFPSAYTAGANGHLLFLRAMDYRSQSQNQPYTKNGATGFAFGTDYNAETKTGTVSLRDSNNTKYSIGSYTFKNNSIKVTASVGADNCFKLYADNDKLMDIIYKPTNNKAIMQIYDDNMAYIDNLKVTSCEKLGIDSFASELTLGAVNATTKVVLVDLNGVTNGYSVDAASLADNVKLYKRVNGVDEEVTDLSFKVNSPHQGTDAAGNEVTVAGGNTITIIPVCGVTPNVPYRVVIGEGVKDSSPAEVSVTEVAETEYFYVQVLYSSDFNVKYDEEGNLAAPYYVGSDGSVYNSDWDMSENLTSVSVSGNNLTLATDLEAGDDTALATKNNAAPLVLKKDLGNDYTIEYNYRLPKSTVYLTGIDYHKAGLRGGNFAKTDAPYYSTGFKIFDKKSTGSTKVDIAFSSNNADEYTMADYEFGGYYGDIRISGIGNNFKMYVNGEKLFDVEKESPYNGGAFAMLDAAQTGNIGVETHMSEIDDMTITRLNYVTDVNSKVAITNLGTSDFNGETIKVNARILNMTYADKDFDVYFASYDEYDRLIDTAQADASIDVNSSDEYTVTLDNKDKNTSYIKVFAWKTNLEPLGKAVKKK